MRYALFTRTYVGVAYSMNQSTEPVCIQLALSDADGYLAFPVIIATLGIRNDLFVTDSARLHRYVHMR
jgi:hypothetical protein